MRHSIWACAGLCALAVGCAYGDAPLEEVNPDSIPQTVTWEDHVEPVMERHCAGCHSDAVLSGAAAGLDFRRFDVAVCAFEDVLETTMEKGSMPPGGARRLDGWSAAVLRRWEQQRYPRALAANGAPVREAVDCRSLDDGGGGGGDGGGRDDDDD